MSGMPYPDFLNAVIDDAETDVRAHLDRPNQNFRREGALDGLAACRDQSPADLANLLSKAKRRTEVSQKRREVDYWFWRERELQIGWVLGVMSAGLDIAGHRPPAGYTGRQYLKAADIFGMDQALASP